MSYQRHPEIFTGPKPSEFTERLPFSYARPAPAPVEPDKARTVYPIEVGATEREAFIVCAHSAVDRAAVRRELMRLGPIKVTEYLPCTVHRGRRHWIVERVDA